ncbi:hypothetical protein OHC33_002505 [Knufia fluminis]|uniref:SCP domain-containing protein n=2 Tax=Knufia TaxID=430999 RepID=A0AAN8EPW8_9EURO|nr:hypothetical protein OHC33_002505 [Knufia fluminis]
MAVALAAGVQAQTTVTICESYSYTDTITFTEYTTYYVTNGANGGTRSTTSSSSTSLASLTLPPASTTSNTNTNGGIGGSRSTTTMTSSTTGVPGNGTEVIIPGDEELVTPSTPIPTSSSTTVATTTTTTSLTTVASTDPEVTSSSFYIVFNVPTATPAAQRLSKRAVEYLAFDEEGQSILVTSESEAATFTLDDDGLLKSGSQFVALDEDADPPRFSIQDEQPETPVEINVDGNGNVSIPEVEGFCVQGDDLVVLTDGAEASDVCEAVEPELVAAQDETGTTTSLSSTVSSTGTQSTSVDASTTTTGTEATTESTSSTTSADSSTTTDAESSTSTESTTSTETTTSAEATTTTTSETSFTSSSATTTTSTATEPEITNKAYIDTVIRHHNRHRANHTADPLTWDPALAATAKKIADGCIYAHDTATDCPPNEDGSAQACYGQNIGAGYLPVQMGSIITDGFYNGEVNYYTYYGGEPDTATLHQWGHFSQIVWRDTETVGCYTTDCSANGLGNIDPSTNIRPFFTVCNYGPPGNWLGEFVDNVIQPVNLPTIGSDYQCPSAENCEDGA